VQYPGPRADCPVCQDERQYVGWNGQQWTSLAELRRTGHRGRIAAEGPGVTGVGTDPSFAIGQRALLVRGPSGNVLWDCITYLDDEVAARVRELGGIDAIAISHPHYYGTMIEWARMFEAPVYVHAADREWVGRPGPAVTFWEGDTLALADGLTLINAGVHFSGGTVLHRAAGADGAGALFSGDILQVVMDRDWVSFMYSYPNLIPERPDTIRRALGLLAPYDFERV
jgi:Metallo-beta-lactamase superfamily